MELNVNEIVDDSSKETQLTYEDILNNLGFFYNEGQLTAYKKPEFAKPQQQSRPIVANSDEVKKAINMPELKLTPKYAYIYNKYVKRYETSPSPVPQIDQVSSPSKIKTTKIVLPNRRFHSFTEPFFLYQDRTNNYLFSFSKK